LLRQVHNAYAARGQAITLLFVNLVIIGVDDIQKRLQPRIRLPILSKIAPELAPK
jgi:hypothetical protein